MNDPGVSSCFSGSAVSAGVSGTVDFGVLGDPTEAVVRFSKDGLVEIGGLVGRLASRGSRENTAFGLSVSILSDMMHSWAAAKPCASLYSSHRNRWRKRSPEMADKEGTRARGSKIGTVLDETAITVIM